MTKIRSADCVGDRRPARLGRRRRPARRPRRRVPGPRRSEGRWRPARHHRPARRVLPAEVARRGSRAGVTVGRQRRPIGRTPPTARAAATSSRSCAARRTTCRRSGRPSCPVVLRHAVRGRQDRRSSTARSTPAAGRPSSQTGPFYCPVDELVYIDLGFMQQLEQQLVGTTSDLAEQYIVAHEYGHHIQNLLGIERSGAASTSRPIPADANQYSVALELQADCYAGVWVADVAARGLLDSAAEIERGARRGRRRRRRLHPVEDAGRVDQDACTHGTSAQRQTWLDTGLPPGDPRQCDGPSAEVGVSV